MPVDDALDAEADDVLEVLRYGQASGPLDGPGRDCLGDGVLGSVLQRACKTQQFSLVHARCGEDVLELHAARGHRAGLVEDDGVHATG